MYFHLSACDLKMNKRKSLQLQLPLLKLIARLDASERDILLRSLHHTKCESIYDCLYNALTNKTIDKHWKSAARAKLSGKEKKLRLLLDKEVPTEKKHKTLVQVCMCLSVCLSQSPKEYFSRWVEISPGSFNT